MKTILILILFFALANITTAALVITLEGQPGSADMVVRGSGSITESASTVGHPSGTIILTPSGNTYFATAFLLKGNRYQNSWINPNVFDEDRTLTGDFGFELTGTCTAAEIEMDDEAALGEDNLVFREDVDAVYHPGASSAFTFSLVGSSTFTLPPGNTSDDLIDPPAHGATATLTFTVTNNGSDPASSVSPVETLPASRETLSHKSTYRNQPILTP